MYIYKLEENSSRPSNELECSKTIIRVGMIALHLACKGKVLLSVPNGMCHLCTFYLICRPLCNIGMRLITLLSILMPRYW